ncbi:PIN domain-containing protein [Streptomyces sp. NPDC002076]
MSDYHSGSFTVGYEEFWRKPAHFVDDAIKSSSIILDTNAVLNLYRMKPSARDEYIKVLEAVAERIWIPRQVADEFHRNRLSSVAGHANSLKEKSEAVSSAADGLRKAVRDFYKLHSLADGRSSEYLTPVNNSISQIIDSIMVEVEEYDLNPGTLLSRDPILERLAILFDERVGDGIPRDRQDEVKKEAVRRGSEGIPPGYVDVKKKGEGGIGDYLIWAEILDYAATVKRSVLFVSTDIKEDWIRIQCGLPVGPRPELVREMRETAGVSFHQLPLATFLARASIVLNVRVSQNTIDQVNDKLLPVEEMKQHVSKRRLEIDRIAAHIASVRENVRIASLEVQEAAVEAEAVRARHQAEVAGQGGEYLPDKYFATAERLHHAEARYVALRNELESLERQWAVLKDEVNLLKGWVV